MALIARVARLFNADVHAVLDRIEEPEALLKQAVRDMTEEVTKTEQQLKWLRGELPGLQKRADSGARAVTELASELDICFAAEEEELARSIVRRKLAQEQRNKAVAEQLDEAASRISELDSLLAERREQLAEMQQKAELFCDAHTASDPVSESAITRDEVEVAFLREKQARSSS